MLMLVGGGTLITILKDMIIFYMVALTFVKIEMAQIIFVEDMQHYLVMKQFVVVILLIVGMTIMAVVLMLRSRVNFNKKGLDLYTIFVVYCFECINTN